MEFQKARNNAVTSLNKVNSLGGAHCFPLLFPLFHYFYNSQINTFTEYMHVNQVEQLAHCLANHACS